MDSQNEPIRALEEIKQIMERSSRFVSLSGWSGIAAGICGLVSAWIANNRFNHYALNEKEYETSLNQSRNGSFLQLDRELLILGVLTFVAAFFFAFLFTWMRSKKTGVPLWGFMARRVLLNLGLPMAVGAFMIWRITQLGVYGLVVPACLIFYGLALINGSRFTVSEVRYLGYLQLLLGVVNLWAIGYGLYFWAAGFGVLHILYGIVMWNRYERNNKTEAQ